MSKQQIDVTLDGDTLDVKVQLQTLQMEEVRDLKDFCQRGTY